MIQFFHGMNFPSTAVCFMWYVLTFTHLIEHFNNDCISDYRQKNARQNLTTTPFTNFTRTFPDFGSYAPQNSSQIGV